MILWILLIVFGVAGFVVQSVLQNKFERYSRIPLGGMRGCDVAMKMLNDHGIYDVKVTCTPGHLTDHYNPLTKTVNLSESVYRSNSGSSRCSSARVWTCSAACNCLFVPANALEAGTGGEFCFAMGYLGYTCWHLIDRGNASIALDRYCIVCYHYFV